MQSRGPKKARHGSGSWLWQSDLRLTPRLLVLTISKHLWPRGSSPQSRRPAALGPCCPPPNPPAPWPAGWFSPHRETQRQCVPWGCPGSLRPFSSSQTCCVPQGRLLASLSLSVPDGLAQTVLGGYVAHTDGKHAARLSPALVAGSASSGQFPDLPGPPS